MQHFLVFLSHKHIRGIYYETLIEEEHFPMTSIVIIIFDASLILWDRYNSYGCVGKK